jgi:hypothetical protein
MDPLGRTPSGRVEGRASLRQVGAGAEGTSRSRHDDHAHVVVLVRRSNASSSSPIIWPVNAFSLSGRSSVMVRIPLSTSHLICSTSSSSRAGDGRRQLAADWRRQGITKYR